MTDVMIYSLHASRDYYDPSAERYPEFGWYVGWLTEQDARAAAETVLLRMLDDTRAELKAHNETALPRLHGDEKRPAIEQSEYRITAHRLEWDDKRPGAKEQPKCTIHIEWEERRRVLPVVRTVPLDAAGAPNAVTYSLGAPGEWGAWGWSHGLNYTPRAVEIRTALHRINATPQEIAAHVTGRKHRAPRR